MTTEITTPGFDYGQLDAETAAFMHEATNEIRSRGAQTAENIFRIGQLLLAVKARLPHGAWLPWLSDAFAWTDRQAQRFMLAYKTFGRNTTSMSDLAAFLDPTSIYQLAAPSTPETARQEVMAKVEAGETLTTKAVKATIAKHKPPRKPKPIDGDREPTQRPQPQPKPEPVEGVDYEIREDQWGFKHRRPLGGAEFDPASDSFVAWINGGADEVAAMIIAATDDYYQAVAIANELQRLIGEKWEVATATNGAAGEPIVDPDADWRAAFAEETKKRGGQVAMAKALGISQASVSKVHSGATITPRLRAKFEALT